VKAGTAKISDTHENWDAWMLERRKRMVTCLAHESLKWCFNLTHYF